jgi:formylglycine-generating enzyme required for sulfatase activity
MKLSLATIALFVGSLLIALGQNSPQTKQSPVPAAGSSTNLPKTTPAPAPDTSTNKLDLKALMAESTFTNSTGMVMVKVSANLWAGKYEVTQEEYQKVMGSNPSQFRGDRNPVDSVSWNDARTFCSELTKMEDKSEMLPEGFVYELPTQAQWESFAGGATLENAVTSQRSSRTGTAPVGSLGASGPGLYDVRGNVWEWCLDPQDKPYRVLRGGSWDTTQEANLRPEFRWYSTGPDESKNSFGFRCVLIRGAVTK